MANIREIANKANVSPSTVSRVLNGTAPVNERTRQRVEEVLLETGYVLTPKTKQQKKLRVGILVPRGSMSNIAQHPTIYAIITSFISVLEKCGAQNSMLVLEDDLPEDDGILARPLDGYLILGTSQSQEDWLFERLLRLGYPYIIVNRWVREKYLNYVNIDDVNATMDAVQYLLERGRKKIAFIGGNPNFRNTKLRLTGFQNALNNNGLTVPEAYVTMGEYTERSGYEAGLKLLSLPEPPDAGFFTSDTLAIGFQKACEEKGLALPNAFYMVGYGDIELASHVIPPLTTVRMPVEAMGVQAAQALLNLIQEPQVAKEQILMKAALIKRKSCGEYSAC